MFAGFYHFYKKKEIGQLKDWVGQVLFLVSCPKGQVKKNVNVEAWEYKVKTVDGKRKLQKETNGNFCCSSKMQNDTI